MAETIFQKRIFELQSFIPVAVGQPEYEDPGAIYLAVDKLNWAEAKKITLLEFIFNLHKEQGPISHTSVIVAEVFQTPFASNQLLY